MVRKLKYESTDEGMYYEYAGLSTDDKPVIAGQLTGSLFLEVDTGDVYAYDEEGDTGSEWVKIAELGGSGSGSLQSLSLNNALNTSLNPAIDSPDVQEKPLVGEDK